MNLDVRTPAGIMFLILGGVLAIYGMLSDPALYQRSLGINVNLGWGTVMAAFGAGLLWWRRLAPARPGLSDRARQ
jgi:uncharacterized membrane protein YczE